MGKLIVLIGGGMTGFAIKQFMANQKLNNIGQELECKMGIQVSNIPTFVIGGAGLALIITGLVVKS